MDEKYKHTVQYYETDKMGITHHSNYIRWMEEARVYFLDKIGFNYARLEQEGIMSPVISVSCNYKISTVFAQEIFIQTDLLEYNGVKMKIGYTMYDDKERIICDGYSEHCFLGQEGRPIRLKNENMEFHKTLIELVKSEGKKN